ncbi:MAG: hypothetical protein DRR16_03500 [Candidatus Parabeggiatoa sp. nov. 3]|nr:MAG: hypothetical protein DRR00_18360 [Gammaproteobacteria bacterium]RKZ69007.1 MAG: hypothetical protein DRQ99_02105 [Gammaproteobacteria bacterium]RKZ89025.1 MAG: hypothetical protein DRR16_03500 [Gammaproteobacteria bacterium]
MIYKLKNNFSHFTRKTFAEKKTQETLRCKISLDSVFSVCCKKARLFFLKIDTLAQLLPY